MHDWSCSTNASITRMSSTRKPSTRWCGISSAPYELTHMAETRAEARPVLQVDGLRVHLFTRWGVVKAAEDVSFSVGRGETLGLVGESGSGKTMACLAILRLLPAGARILDGRVLFDGDDLLMKSERAMR